MKKHSYVTCFSKATIPNYYKHSKANGQKDQGMCAVSLCNVTIRSCIVPSFAPKQTIIHRQTITLQIETTEMKNKK